MNSMKSGLIVGVAAIVALASVVFDAQPAAAAPCAMSGTDYGVVTATSSVGSAGTYRIWTRMAAPNSTDNSYLLEIDNTTCFTVGGSTVPVYSNGTATHFQAGKTNWISVTTAGTPIDISLSSGSHTFKLIGTSSGVVIDRIIVTADTSCVPVGSGDNCASVYVAADLNTDSKVDFLDFSMLAGKYTQTSNLGRADINGDGVVNFLDYSILASRYGE